jgi:hypothetical protein
MSRHAPRATVPMPEYGTPLANELAIGNRVFAATNGRNAYTVMGRRDVNAFVVITDTTGGRHVYRSDARVNVARRATGIREHEVMPVARANDQPVKEIPADPYGNDYATFRRDALDAMRYAGVLLWRDGNGTRAAEWLADITRWAGKWAARTGTPQWANASRFTAEIVSVIGSGTDVEEIAATLMSAELAWGLPS